MPVMLCIGFIIQNKNTGITTEYAGWEKDTQKGKGKCFQETLKILE